MIMPSPRVIPRMFRAPAPDVSEHQRKVSEHRRRGRHENGRSRVPRSMTASSFAIPVHEDDWRLDDEDSVLRHQPPT